MQRRPGRVPPNWSLIACSVAACAASISYVFAPEWLSGFARFSGERYDGSIALAIHEHWRAVLAGTEAWDRVRWFYPYPRTLAYNDGYLLHGLVYAGLRALGAQIFAAGDGAQMVLRASGFAAVVLIGRRFLALGAAAAVLAATVATIAGSLLLETLHAQFAALGPGLMTAWLALETARRLRDGRRIAAIAWGLAAAALYGCVLLSAFYVAWTLVLLAITTSVLLIAAAPRRALAALRPSVAGAGALAVIATAALIAAAPALWLYLPLAHATGMHDLDAVRAFAGGPASLVNVGAGDFAWGWLPARLTAFGTGPAPHGDPPLLLATAFAGTIAAAWPRRGRTRPEAPLVLALGLAGLGLAALTIDWGGVWPWAEIWRWVPGARAIRVPSRVVMLTSPAVALVAAWLIARLAARRGAAAVLAAMLGIALIGEQLQTPLAPTIVAPELARLAALPPPPPHCAAFAASRPREGIAPSWIAGIYSHNDDAMLISELIGLPTINGVSTFTPPDFDLDDPNQRDYGARVRAYATRHGFAGALCGLDLHDLTWTGPGQPLAWQRAP